MVGRQDDFRALINPFQAQSPSVNVVIKADDIGDTPKRFLYVAGVAGRQLIDQPHPLVPQAASVIPEMTHLAPSWHLHIPDLSYAARSPREEHRRTETQAPQQVSPRH
jgi:hypothetical protein